MSLSRTLRPALATATRATRALSTTTFLRSSKGPIEPGSSEPHRELGVGELQGAKFKIEPLRRTGEDETTMRARLLYQSRKRGTLESDLLMSTFANTHLPAMSKAQMQQYDLFLDENDWDIYYWATQEEEAAAAADAAAAAGSPAPKSTSPDGTPEDIPVRPKAQGEWAQTVGTFKAAYRPVPERWQGSEVLGLLRAHVRNKRADGVATSPAARDGASAGGEKGMGFMPPLFDVERADK